MKVHYISILLFALPLNILVHNQRKHKSTTLHTPKIKTTRLLCECELYSPVNYDNDPQMKAVIENFNRQTSQRFEEYDDRMIRMRQKCKEQCDKEIQKIILKDKLEKQMVEQFATLHTDIQNDAIPTCVCEKSIADKTEKFCLKCGKTIGGVAPGWGLVSGLVYTRWEIAATAAATQKGIEAGISVVIETLKKLLTIDGVSPDKWKTLITIENYTNETLVGGVIKDLSNALCKIPEKETGGSFCLFANDTKTLTKAINGHVPKAISKGTAEVVTVTEAEMEKVTTIGGTYSTGIIASVVAIIVIVLVMVIIYLILRYRRKKKMKKKLQYMKLLKE
ncbi:rifin [Plasmodium reichenowi]|uniref:Rifin n=1 Tax=Plasmodium reichenowi TaxID=5854 RepID=A0A060RQV0_PLARE|nr:rifin [Plasmodium reichenowi]